MPLLIRSSNTGNDRDAGPMVQTILVLWSDKCMLACPFEITTDNNMTKRARRESNLHEQLRRLLPYPLGHGRKFPQFNQTYIQKDLRPSRCFTLLPKKEAK